MWRKNTEWHFQGNGHNQKERASTGTAKRDMTTTTIYLKWDRSTGYRPQGTVCMTVYRNNERREAADRQDNRTREDLWSRTWTSASPATGHRQCHLLSIQCFCSKVQRASALFLHPVPSLSPSLPLLQGKKQPNYFKSFVPMRGWRISMCMMKPSPPYQPPALVILGHKVVQREAASLLHDSSFLPF